MRTLFALDQLVGVSIDQVGQCLGKLRRCCVRLIVPDRGAQGPQKTARQDKHFGGRQQTVQLQSLGAQGHADQHLPKKRVSSVNAADIPAGQGPVDDGFLRCTALGKGVQHQVHQITRSLGNAFGRHVAELRQQGLALPLVLLFDQCKHHSVDVFKVLVQRAHPVAGPLRQRCNFEAVQAVCFKNLNGAF